MKFVEIQLNRKRENFIDVYVYHLKFLPHTLARIWKKIFEGFVYSIMIKNTIFELKNVIGVSDFF